MIKKIDENIKHINNGIAYIIPLLMIIGLLTATNSNNDTLININEYLKYGIYPLFGAFMLYSISDRPGIVPGVVVGIISSYLGLSYLPLIIISFILGFLIKYIQIIFKNTPISIKTITSMVLIPTILVSLGYLFLIIWDSYIEDHMIWFYNVFNNKYVTIILSTILASIMAYDLGGPINKIAFSLGVISLGLGFNSIYMAAIMAGGMIPPLAIAFNATINRKKYIDNKKNAYLNYLNGLLFLTEGALEFIQKEPKKFRVFFMIGSAVAGLIVSFFGVSTVFPHGGILIVFSMEKWHLFILAILVGATVIQPYIYKLEV